MKSMAKFTVGALVAAALMPAAWAQDARNQGYLLDQDGSIVTSSSTGLCWRDSDWTPARAVQPCDMQSTPVVGAAAPAPTPKAIVVAVAPPTVIVQTAPPKPLPQKMSFSADALFAFDKAELKPEGKAMLDDLVQQIKDTSYDTILATGHADRFGNVEYNQKLSLRRADAVKEYLVSRDIPASRIAAEGKGETQPVTKAGDCAGTISAGVIACLQPDRRVDVEMQGTKTMAVAQ